MNFYFLFYQLIKTVEGLEKKVTYLAAHALRISPRDGQANREVLERCGEKLREVGRLLNSKSHISKVYLRRTEVLFQALEIAHRRVLNLAGILALDDEVTAKALWGMLFQAQRDYQSLRAALFEVVGAAIQIELPEADADPKGRFMVILKKEHEFQEELLKLIERGMEVFDENQNLADQLGHVRRSVMESKRNLKRLLNNTSPNEHQDVVLSSKISIVQT